MAMIRSGFFLMGGSFLFLLFSVQGESVERQERGVRFSKSSQGFVSELTVGLEGNRSGEEIRYTLDGSKPKLDSILYTDPITIKATAHIQAILVENGKIVGDLETEYFMSVDRDIAEMQSNLPIVVIDNWNEVNPVQKEYEDAFIGIIEPSDDLEGFSSLSRPFNIVSRCGVKRRGSSTAKNPKFSMGLETQDGDGEDQAIAPFGFPRSSDWVLGASYDIDRSLIRDALIYRLSERIGEYAPRSQLVEVFLNRNGGKLSYADNYMGVYSFTEKIKRGKRRVRVERHRESEKGEKQGGFVFKNDRPDPGDVGIDVPGLGQFFMVYPKESKVSSAQREALMYELEDFGLALKSFSRTHPVSRRHFTDYIDVESWLVWHWLNVLSKNLDIYKASGYFYKEDKDSKISAGPVWDFDRSMNSSDPRDDNPFGWGVSESLDDTFRDPESPWWAQMFADPVFRQRHIDMWHELRLQELSWKSIESEIDQLASQLQKQTSTKVNLNKGRSPIERNFERWSEVPPRGGSYGEEIRIMKQWLQKRLSWIDDQFTKVPVMGVESGWVESGTSVGIEVGDGTELYVSLDGSDPCLPNGQANPSALKSEKIKIDQSTVITARARKGRGKNSWSAPVRRVYLVGNPPEKNSLKITRILSAPEAPKTEAEKAAASEPADFEFIELTNISRNQVVDLTGSRFTKGIKFSFDHSKITHLKAGEKIFLVRNEKAFIARHGTDSEARIAGAYGPSKLDNKGELLRLIDGAGALLLELRFPEEEHSDPTPK